MTDAKQTSIQHKELKQLILDGLGITETDLKGGGCVGLRMSDITETADLILENLERKTLKNNFKNIDDFLNKLPSQEVNCHISTTKPDGKFSGGSHLEPMIFKYVLLEQWNLFKNELEY